MHCIFCVMLSDELRSAVLFELLLLGWSLARDSVLVLSSRCWLRFDSVSMSQTDGARDADATPPRSVRATAWDVMTWSPHWSMMSPPAPRPKRRRLKGPKQPAASPPGNAGALKPDWSAMSPGDFPSPSTSSSVAGSPNIKHSLETSSPPLGHGKEQSKPASGHVKEDSKPLSGHLKEQLKAGSTGDDKGSSRAGQA